MVYACIAIHGNDIAHRWNGWEPLCDNGNYSITTWNLSRHLQNCPVIHLQTYAGLMESIAILLSIYTVLRYGIQRNIFFLVLIAGFCCLYIALFPNTEWSITVTMAMLGKLRNQRSRKRQNATNYFQRLDVGLNVWFIFITLFDWNLLK